MFNLVLVNIAIYFALILICAAVSGFFLRSLFAFNFTTALVVITFVAISSLNDLWPDSYMYLLVPGFMQMITSFLVLGIDSDSKNHNTKQAA